MSKLDIESVLKRTFLFATLDPEEFKLLTSHCSQVKLKRSSHLFLQGRPAEAFFIIVYGKVSIYRLSAEGDEQVLHFHSDNSVVAEAAIFDMQMYPASCKTLKDTLAIKIPKNAFIEMLTSKPELSLKFLAAYSKRLREFVNMVEYLSLDDVSLRFTKYLQKNARKGSHGSWEVDSNLSKKELASILSIAPETLSRVLKKFKDQKIIEEKL